MPGPASIWLTSIPATPNDRVPVVLTSDSEFVRGHTFAAGRPIRGEFPVSEGQYVLSALENACAIDLELHRDRETDVAIRVDGLKCEFMLVREHGPEINHGEPTDVVVP